MIKRVIYLVSQSNELKFLRFSFRMPQDHQPIIIALLRLYKPSSQPESNQPIVNALFRNHKFRKRLWEQIRSSNDSFRPPAEKKATAHDLLAKRSVGTGTSVQTAAIFDRWWWRQTGTETWDPGQECEGNLIILNNDWTFGEKSGEF